MFIGANRRSVFVEKRPQGWIWCAVTPEAPAAQPDALRLFECFPAKRRQLTQPIFQSLILTAGTFTQAVSDTVGLTESLATVLLESDTFDLFASLQDRPRRRLTQPVLRSVYSVGTIFSQSLADTVGLTESATKQVQRIIGETVSLTEALAKVVQIVKAEQPTLTEDEIFSIAKTLSESVGLTEQLTTQTIPAATAPSQPLIARQPDYTRQFAALLNNRFISSGGTVFQQSVADTIVFTEALTKLAQTVKSENVALSENLVKQAARILSESVGLTEDQTIQLNRQISENLSLTENLTATIVALKNLSETVALSENLRQQINKSLGETVGLAENLAKRLSRSLAETVSLTESLEAEYLARTSVGNVFIMDRLNTDLTVSDEIRTDASVGDRLISDLRVSDRLISDIIISDKLAADVRLSVKPAVNG